ncbi:MAG TPA: hypothetical protein VIK95_00520 [Egibacteraceae bacterium]
MRRGALAALCALALLAAGCTAAAEAQPRCREADGSPLVLMLQAVPEATYLPCLATLPESWALTGFDVVPGRATMGLRADAVENGATITVTLTPSCPADAGRARPSGVAGVRRSDLVEEGTGGVVATRTYRFDGGCVRERFELQPRHRQEVLGRAWAVLGLVPAAEVSAAIEARHGRAPTG